MAASKTVRGASLFLALLFLASTIGTVFLIIKQTNDSSRGSSVITSKVSPGEPLKLDAKVTDLQIIDVSVGDGEEVRLDDSITVNYRLNLADGSVVAGNDTFTSGSPITFQLSEGGLIAGWVQGLPGTKVGGLRRLIIPAALAYGDQASGGVPANSDLVFDIEVLDTKR